MLAARTSYGRLVAYLSARMHDVAAAEDALSDAFAKALETWPTQGVPDNPEAWLLTSARRRLIDHSRHYGVRKHAEDTLRMLTEEAAERSAAPVPFPDERLKLLFVCAHPAIDAGARTPLMLQTILGLDAARIGSAFLVAPATMSKRLVRAKARIRSANIEYKVPEPDELPDRLDAVLDAIYAAYGTGWEDADGVDPRRSGLAEETIWLAQLATRLMPDAAEAHGLCALMLLCEARRPARRTATGAYIPLSDQDVTLWSRQMIDDAKLSLAKAAGLHHLGRYQLEAAVQSLHVLRLEGAQVNWALIVQLYNSLVDLSPTAGALIGRAAAIAEAQGTAAGLAALDAIAVRRIQNYQPYWATRSELLSRSGNVSAANDAYTRAIGLTEDRSVRQFLQEKQRRLAEGNR